MLLKAQQNRMMTGVWAWQHFQKLLRGQCMKPWYWNQRWHRNQRILETSEHVTPAKESHRQQQNLLIRGQQLHKEKLLELSCDSLTWTATGVTIFPPGCAIALAQILSSLLFPSGLFTLCSCTLEILKFLLILYQGLQPRVYLVSRKDLDLGLFNNTGSIKTWNS